MECTFLLLISLDGFLWNYLQNFGIQNFPNFSYMMSHGVLAEHLNNVFLTKTFPNHFTIVTGLYQENHGIINNNMFDPLLNSSFKPGNNEERWWDVGGEPIWVTNQRYGNKTTLCNHKSVVVMWPGSETRIKGEYPTHFEKYSKIPLQNKFDKALSLMTQKKFNLGIVYHDQPDVVGHLYGPSSTQVKDKLIELDKDIGYLLEQIKNSHLANKLNIILTSDHGMTEIFNTIVVSKYIDVNQFNWYGSSPTWHLFPKSDENLQEVYKKLANISPFLKVYLKENIPSDWNYKFNQRIAPLILVGEPGWNIAPHENFRFQKGNHGFNKTFSGSWPIFIAHGPMFKKGYISKPLNSIDLYSLMCNILNITPSPNNGTFENIKHILCQEINTPNTNAKYISPSSSLSIPNLFGNRLSKFREFPIWVLVTVITSLVFLVAGLFILGVYKVSHPTFRRSRLLRTPSSYSPAEYDPLYERQAPTVTLTYAHNGYENCPPDQPSSSSSSFYGSNPGPKQNQRTAAGTATRGHYQPLDIYVPS